MDDLYTDPNIAVDAIYQPETGGAAQSVKVLLRRPDQLGTFGETVPAVSGFSLPNVSVR